MWHCIFFIFSIFQIYFYLQIDEDDKIGGDEEGGWDVEENLDIPDVPDEAAGSEGKIVILKKSNLYSQSYKP